MLLSTASFTFDDTPRNKTADLGLIEMNYPTFTTCGYTSH